MGCQQAGRSHWVVCISDIWDDPKNLSAGSFRRCTFKLECVGPDSVRKSTVARRLFSDAGRGCGDVSGVEYMCKGRDEGAWAAKALPTSDSILLRMTVIGLGV